MNSEAKVRLALGELNIRIAAIFNRAVIEPTIQFVPIIDRRQVLQENGQVVTEREVVGTTNHRQKLIRIVPTTGWRETAVHEFVHLYNPGRKEATIKKLTGEVISYLKGYGTHVGIGVKDSVALAQWKRNLQDWEPR